MGWGGALTVMHSSIHSVLETFERSSGCRNYPADCRRKGPVGKRNYFKRKGFLKDTHTPKIVLCFSETESPNKDNDELGSASLKLH